jgi:hypothetical protein
LSGDPLHFSFVDAPVGFGRIDHCLQREIGK